MKIRTFIVDAFTNKPFQGNPAGVCLLDQAIDPMKMQSIASELNLSETAFLLKTKASSNHYNIRYFTPTVEVDFCGHATLASSKIVLDKLDLNKVDFTTHSGLRLEASHEYPFIKMIFPLYDTTSYLPNQKLYEAFGIENPVSTRFSEDLDMLIIEVVDKQALQDVNPDFQKAIESSKTIKELVVTAKSEDEGYDFYSRCFCPWIGINEDPVTGASHSVLAKYWSEKLSKKDMSAFQLSKRGGFLNLSIKSETELEVRSCAKIVFEGTLDV
ncbi:MAG: PhzF family phenazine biosynthesis protein [Reichenbachiella sp.]|uniref:PhzF family phenazine biosynthesis protein n=1 Tax=Reichenbachiella sp. TaxID=2184521 RepID=UPI003263085A